MSYRWSIVVGILVGLFAVGAVMVVVLVPTMHRGPANTSVVTTISDLKHLALAMELYEQDHDGDLPGWASNARGRAYHNVWDQQVAPYARHVGGEVFDGSPLVHRRAIRSPSQPSPRDRTIAFGLNGLLITPPKRTWDGNADWDHGPRPIRPQSLKDAANTILLAELATDQPMPGAYSHPEVPAAPSTPSMASDSEDYVNGITEWIDIDPRAWVETSGPVYSNNKDFWDIRRGVARALYDRPGACYAFADGHVQFLKIGETVGLEPDNTAGPNAWTPSNPRNLWNPNR